MKARRHWLLLSVAASLLGCQTVAPPQATGRTSTMRPRQAPVAPQALRNGQGRAVTAVTSARLVSPGAGPVVPLRSGVRFSDDGARLIGVDAGTLIGVDAGTLIGVDAGTMIGVDAGTLIGVDAGTLIGVDAGTLVGVDAGSLAGLRVSPLMGEVRVPVGTLDGRRYGLAGTEASVPAEGVRVYIRDAEGRFVVDAAGALVSAVTDARGRFIFRDWLPIRGLTCWVPTGEAAGEPLGLAALRPRDQGIAAPVAIDPASSLLAGWVDATVLQQQAAALRGEALDRLTTLAAARARRELQRVLERGVDVGATAWDPRALASEAERLLGSDGALEGALTTVKRVMLLAGADQCAREAAALDSALRLPVAVAAPAGTDELLVATLWSGHLIQVRGLADNARLTAVGGPCPSLAGTAAGGLPAPSRLASGPGGWVYAASAVAGTVHRLRPDGSDITLVAGGGSQAVALGLAGAELRLDDLTGLGVTPGGDVWLGLGVGQPRLVRLDAQGRVAEVTAPWLPRGSRVVGIACGKDGALWLLAEYGGSGDLLRRGPGEDAWRLVSQFPGQVNRDVSSLAALPGGSVVASLADGGRQQHRLVEVAADGERRVLAGAGPAGSNAAGAPVAGAEARFSRPAGLAVREDATGGWVLYVADLDNGLVRAVDPRGRVSIVAGSREGDDVLAGSASLNLATSLTLDALGRPVLVEGGAFAIRRLEDDRLVRIAGGEAGRRSTPDRVPATRLDGPFSIASVGSGFYVSEVSAGLVCHLDADGEIAVVAGGGTQAMPLGMPGRVMARDINFERVLAVATDPQGRALFSARPFRGPSEGASGAWCVFRVEPDGTLTRLAGSPGGVAGDPREGKQASEVGLGLVGGLAADRAGNIYLSEVVEAAVWRIDPRGVFTRVGGVGLTEALRRVDTWQEPVARDEVATDAVLLTPFGLGLDPAGNLHVAEFGTQGLAAFAEHVGVNLGFDIELLPKVSGRVRVISPDGRARVVAGQGADGAVRNPIDVKPGPRGEVLVIDFVTGQLKALRAPSR